MDKNTQLPVEVEKSIEDEASEYAAKRIKSVMITGLNKSDLKLISAIDYAAGATAYASKLHQLDEHFKVMSISCDAQLEKIHQLQLENAELRRQNDKMKSMATGWRPLLEKVLVMNEMWGDLPGEFINEVKKFLYGE